MMRAPDKGSGTAQEASGPTKMTYLPRDKRMVMAVPRIPDALSGLAPVASSACPRCGWPTSALANGRGRLDICEPCGTFEMVTPEGLELFRLKDASPKRPLRYREGGPEKWGAAPETGAWRRRG